MPLTVWSLPVAAALARTSSIHPGRPSWRPSTSKSVRLANYVTNLRKEILQLSHACGVAHPALIQGDQLEILDSRFGSSTVREHFGYQAGFELPGAADRTAAENGLI